MNNATNSGGSAAVAAPSSGHDDHGLCLPLAEQGKVPFITPGVMVLMGLAAIGLLVLAARFIFGIGAVTNLGA